MMQVQNQMLTVMQQQQQQQQQQPQQPQQHQQIAIAPVDPQPAGGALLLAPPASLPQIPRHAAPAAPSNAKSAGVKQREKVQAKAWNSKAGPKCLLLMGVLLAAIEFGMENAEDFSRARVATWRLELETMVSRLNNYLQLHFMLLQPFEAKARDALVSSINADLEDGFYTVAVQADLLQRKFCDGQPAADTVDSSVASPRFKRLKNLTEPDFSQSLAERVKNDWTRPAPPTSSVATAGTKRKAARGAGKKPPAKQAATGPGKPPWWASRTFWYGKNCLRDVCNFSHVNGRAFMAGIAGAAGTAPQQQQPLRHYQQPLQHYQQPQPQQPQFQPKQQQ
eukprot:g4140.t1